MGVHRAESERETTHLLGNSAAGAEQQAAAGARVGGPTQSCPGPGPTLLTPSSWSWRPGPGCEEEILVIGDSSTMTAVQ